MSVVLCVNDNHSSKHSVLFLQLCGLNKALMKISLLFFYEWNYGIVSVLAYLIGGFSLQPFLCGGFLNNTQKHFKERSILGHKFI